MPAGMPTFSLLRCCTRPSPPQRLHGFVRIWPVPLQRGQVDGHREKTAGMGHLALAMTRRAGFGLAALGGAATVAFGTRIELGEGDFLFEAARRLFEIDLPNRNADRCRAARRYGATATATAAESLFDEIVKNAAARAAENIAKNFKRVVKPAP